MFVLILSCLVEQLNHASVNQMVFTLNSSILASNPVGDRPAMIARSKPVPAKIHSSMATRWDNANADLHLFLMMQVRNACVQHLAYTSSLKIHASTLALVNPLTTATSKTALATILMLLGMDLEYATVGIHLFLMKVSRAVYVREQAFTFKNWMNVLNLVRRSLNMIAQNRIALANIHSRTATRSGNVNVDNHTFTMKIHRLVLAEIRSSSMNRLESVDVRVVSRTLKTQTNVLRNVQVFLSTMMNCKIVFAKIDS